MTTAEMLTDAFRAHEYLAPDADAVLAAVGIEIEQARRRRTTRTVGVLGAAAAVAAAAAGAQVLGHGPAPGAPAVRTQSVARTATPTTATPTTATPTTAAPTATPTTPRTTVTPPATTAPTHFSLAPGWLPGRGGREYAQSVAAGHQTRGYDTFIHGVETAIVISLDTGRALPTWNKRGTAHDLSINGRPAREWRSDGSYTLAFETGDNHIASVALQILAAESFRNGSAAELADIGRHVARDLRFDRHDPVRPGLTATSRPSATRAR